MWNIRSEQRRVVALLAAIASSPSFLSGTNFNSPLNACLSQPNTRAVALPVRVMTQKLKAIEDLHAFDFTLKRGRTPLQICGVAHDRQPVSIGILLDTSGSMRGTHSNLPAISQAAINRLLDTSGGEDEYFLEYVSDTAAMKCRFSCDRQRIRDGLQLHPKGTTALIDGIYLALHGMSKAHYSNRALLVVSDGYDNQSIYKFKELEDAFADSPIPVFLLIPAELHFPRPHWIAMAEDAPRDRLVQLIGKSGGYSMIVFSAKEAVEGMTQLAAVMRSPYILYFATPPGRDIRSLRGLQVEVKGVHPSPLLFYGLLFEATPSH